MQVVIPAPTMDFDFNSSRPSLFLSAPSSPKRIGELYFSAPTSPSRVSEFYREFDNFEMVNEEGSNSLKTSNSSIPFDWEEKPGTPKSSSPKASAVSNVEDDFAFDFCVELEKTSLTAEELFDGGKIRPLKPPPGLQLNSSTNKFDDYAARKSSVSSPRSPISQGKKIIQNAFSPRQRKDIDPFAAAVENTRGKTEHRERGRERAIAASSSSRSSSRRASRSVSPLRVSAFPWVQEDQLQTQQDPKQSSSINSKSSTSSSSKSSRIWKLTDFLLFRSASEGRATDKDPFKKYAGPSKRHEDSRNASFRSTDISGSVSGGSRRRGQVSAHELHYTTNRAVAEDMKKKTYLPYKQGILGRLSINPFGG